MKAVVFAAATAMVLATGVASADEALARKHACLSCHQVAKKVVGPAYKDVAAKYRGDAKALEHLVNVIKKGGKGVWGPIPMPPNPQVSDADAKKLAEWVLSL